jgi:hypothetical protein
VWKYWAKGLGGPLSDVVPSADAPSHPFASEVVPPGDVGFWQAGARDPADPDYPALRQGIEERRLFTIELLYSDHEGGQRAIGRFVVAPRGRNLLALVPRAGTSIGRIRADA